MVVCSTPYPTEGAKEPRNVVVYALWAIGGLDRAQYKECVPWTRQVAAADWVVRRAVVQPYPGVQHPMSVLPAEDLLGAAAEEVLAQLDQVPLIRERVWRYLPNSARKRIAGRIASATLAKVFQRAATLLNLPSVLSGDIAIGLLPDRGFRYPSRGQYVRYCYGCGANRPAHYSGDRVALVCMKCGLPTGPMRTEPTGDPQPLESPARQAG